jgi:alkylation response protein AidB-like acyl-CoA dehydrogenase
MDSLLADSVDRFLARHVDLSAVRAVEAGAGSALLWRALQESGFANGLVPEEKGGAGLTLTEVAPIILACGRYAVPLPLGQTLLVRAALAEGGQTIPEGAITIAGPTASTVDGVLLADDVPFGMTSDWAVLSTAQGDWLLPVAAAEKLPCGGEAGLTADLIWRSLPDKAIGLTGVDWIATGAAITSGLMAGAMEKLTEMTIAYANDRVQFGKPIGKQQAIQHQISVMAEHFLAGRTAALVGLSGSSWRPGRMRAALAKGRAGEAAVSVAAISHAVHGAIGVTAEYDLQIFTRRLHEARRHYGGASYWYGVLGRSFLDDPRSPLPFIRETLAHLPDAGHDR